MSCEVMRGLRFAFDPDCIFWCGAKQMPFFIADSVGVTKSVCDSDTIESCMHPSSNVYMPTCFQRLSRKVRQGIRNGIRNGVH